MKHTEGMGTAYAAPAHPSSPEESLPIAVSNTVQSALMREWHRQHPHSKPEDSMMAWSVEDPTSPASEFRRLVENDPAAVQKIYDIPDTAEKQRHIVQLLAALLKTSVPVSTKH